MPRSVDHTVSLDVPVDVLYQRFTTVEYWEDLVGFWKSCNLDTELRELSTDDSGTDVHFAHIMSAKDLPSIARKVVPGKFVVMRVLQRRCNGMLGLWLCGHAPRAVRDGSRDL